MSLPDGVEPIEFGKRTTQAHEILEQGAAAIRQRAASRDLEQTGERSMLRTVAAFNALTGHSLSEREGWVFMVMLKAARAQLGALNPDDYVDGAAYFALAGECAATAGGGS